MPERPPLLRIGPFSRASSLSVKALRAYHEGGLLVPAVVDPATGYRSYTLDQLTDATIIRRLRALEVPLDVVRTVLDARDPAVTRKVLVDHSAILEERLAVTQRAIDELYAAVDIPALHTPVHVRQEPATVVLMVEATVSEADFASFLDRAEMLLVEAATTSGAVVVGAFGGSYPTLLEDDAQDVTAYLPVREAPLVPGLARSAGVAVGELPEGPVAVLAHHGGYETLADSYRQLGAWVAAHAEPADLPVRESYLVGKADTDDPALYRTEICWPVERR